MRIAVIAALAAGLAAPALAQAPAAPAADPAPVFQVLRATDKDMSCEQMSGEINTLNAGVMQQQQANAEAAQKSARNRAVLGRLGGAALALGGQAALMNGAMSNPLARGVFSAANQAANSAGATPAAGTAPATVTPQQQRLTHLMTLYTAKAC